MSRNIEMNYKTDTVYEPLYPQTTCDMVIDLLNTDTKSLMGLPTTATGDDAFRELFLAITLDGRALINFTVTGNDGTPCKGVQIESSAFCDSNGNLTPTVVTDDEGKVSVFCNNTSVAVSVSQYGNFEDWEHNYTVVFGEQYEENVTLIRRNFLKITTSCNLKFSPEIVRVDVTSVGGGGNGGRGDQRDLYRGTSGGGGGGGYCVVMENRSFVVSQINSCVIGSAGGTSSFLGVIAEGGQEGGCPSAGEGNGRGGDGVSTTIQQVITGNQGQSGTVLGYSSFTESIYYGGGGGSGSLRSTSPGLGSGYGGNGGYGNTSSSTSTTLRGENGQNGFGGGGGGGGCHFASDDRTYALGGTGGSGCVAIRMYTQSTLPV